jgi:hypothetical protein
MTYTVQIAVTDFKSKKAIQGASISDGGQNQTVTTNKDGVANFKVESVDDDPDLPDNIQISAKNYGPQSATLEPSEPSIAIELQPYPTPPPAGQTSKPTVKLQANEPATLQGPGAITVSWVSSQYDKFLIWWTENGQTLAQGEVDNSGESGNWTTNQPIIPGAVYTFEVEGGTYAGLSGYNYSGWGNTVTVTAVQNLRSLVQFLLHSGMNPAGLKVSSIMAGRTSLKQVMKLN